MALQSSSSLSARALNRARKTAALVTVPLVLAGASASCVGSDERAKDPVVDESTQDISGDAITEWVDKAVPHEMTMILKGTLVAVGMYQKIPSGVTAAFDLVNFFLGTLTHDPAPPDAFAKLGAKIDQAAGTIIFFDQLQALDRRTAALKAAAEQGADQLLRGSTLPELSTADFESLAAVNEAGGQTPFLRYFVEAANNGETVAGQSKWKATIPDRPELFDGPDGAHNLVYDWRIGVPSLMDAITLRLVVLATIHPAFKNDGYFHDQLMTMRDDLQRQYSKIAGGVRCGISYFGDPAETDPSRRPTIDARTICADIYTGLSATHLRSIARSEVSHEPCTIIINHGSWIETRVDQACIAQKDVNWITFKNTMDSFKGELTGRVRHHLPLYHMQAMMDSLALFATPRPDLTEGATRIATDSFQEMCVQPNSESSNAGTPILLAACTGAAAQGWQYDRSRGRIVHTASGRCLEVKDANVDNGKTVQIANCNDKDEQQWTYDPDRRTLFSGLGTYLYRPNNDLTAQTPVVSGLLSPFTFFSGAWK